ncbi:NfrA family protein [Glaciimonas soli]|uniref:Bacteriophage N4 adsorption protein A C-terminal domain-containing protein n=1 Tax=Glaciimonas soli TaxID=2590999 RepID=A0A843YNV4_9BURK|nr:hypothetical protein [Glaciimonas soli]MQR01155.1 hypothetical protein [Glaciimonas soli]
MRLKNLLRFVVLLSVGIHMQARAAWLDSEWHNFRVYPRLQRSYDLYKAGDYAGALVLLQQAEKIDPNKRDARILHAQTCEKLHDIACLRQLGEDWERRFQRDPLGYYIVGYVKKLGNDDNQAIEQFRSAIEHVGLHPDSRTKAGRELIDALFRLKRYQEAQATIAWLQQQKVFIADADSQRWNRQLVAAAAGAEVSKAAKVAKVAPEEVVAPINISKQKTVSSKEIVPPPDSQFPYRELSEAMRTQRIIADFYHLTAAQHYSDLEGEVAVLRRENLFTPAIQEALALNLENKNCPLLLQEIAVDADIRETTEHSQMAAAYCASAQPERSAQHFHAASSVRAQAGLQPLAQTLRSEGDAWYASQQLDKAMQSWDASLQQQENPELARNLVDLAIQHPELPSSVVIVTRYRHFLPPGQLALTQAYAAQHRGDNVAAEANFRTSLAESPKWQVWYELANLMRSTGNSSAQGEALSEALKLNDEQSLLHAEYAYWLKSNGQSAAALLHFQRAVELDSQRTELIPEIALLEMKLGQSKAAIRDFRASIDQSKNIQSRNSVSGEAAENQLYAWQRAVQTLEDRWSISAGTQVRLNQGPIVPDGVGISPSQYAQFGGAVDFEAAYRLDPLWDAEHPSWLFARASQGLENRSFEFMSGNTLAGIGFRQRLLADENVLGSVEWLYRNGSDTPSDVMLRLSGSHSFGTDWRPTGTQWTSFNVYGDIARLLREKSYYLTLSAELGRQQRLAWLDGKSTFMPYVGSALAINNDNFSNTAVSRVDAVMGIALQSWHGADPWRAPDVRQRLSLEVRQRIGGNSLDHTIVLLQWRIFH